VDWLGPDREAIGAEKAGIFRPGRPAVLGEDDPPASVLAHARALGAPVYRAGRDFASEPVPGGWRWRGPRSFRAALPAPALRGAVQVRNAAACLMALELLAERLPLSQDAVRRGLQEVRLPGRFQIVPGEVEWILDVAHNPDGVAVLAANLRAHRAAGRTWAVLGMLAGKDASGVARVLDELVDGWYVADLRAETGRAADVDTLVQALGQVPVRGPVARCGDLRAACRSARAGAAPGDRVVVFGSFFTVAGALRDCV